MGVDLLRDLLWEWAEYCQAQGGLSAEGQEREGEVYDLPLWLLGTLRVGWPELGAVWMFTSGHKASNTFGYTIFSFLSTHTPKKIEVRLILGIRKHQKYYQ